jgi:hypothetical protein
VINWNIPQTITQGDRVFWSQILDGYNNITDTLSCFIRGASGGIDLTGVPSGDGWDFTINEAQSTTFASGNYKAQFVVFSGLGRETLGTVDLLVCPSFENLTEFDARTADQKELAVITEAIGKLVTGAVAEYRVGDRMMRYQDLNQLTQRQRELRNRIAKTKNPGGRNVPIRFSD